MPHLSHRLTVAPSRPIVKSMLNQPDSAKVFEALGESTRRAIIDRLSRGPTSVSALAEPLGVTLAAVLQHVQVVKGGVALLEAALHAGLQHPVAVLLGEEHAGRLHLGAAVTEVAEHRGVDDGVAGQRIPLEGVREPLDGRDLAVAALEAVSLAASVLGEAPVAAALDLHALDVH